jgi:hypothetical protein
MDRAILTFEDIVRAGACAEGVISACIRAETFVCTLEEALSKFSGDVDRIKHAAGADGSGSGSGYGYGYGSGSGDGDGDGDGYGYGDGDGSGDGYGSGYGSGSGYGGTKS